MSHGIISFLVFLIGFIFSIHSLRSGFYSEVIMLIQFPLFFILVAVIKILIGGNIIENITRTAEKRNNVPLVKFEQVNMRIDPVHLERLKLLAKKCGEKYTTLLTRLLIEDIDRIWSLSRKIS